MKKFFKHLSLFLIIITVLAYGADYMISHGLRKTDISCLQVWNDIYASNIKSDAIVIGNSRACFMYDPHILDSITGLNFYNLGMDAHAINYQIIRYNTFRRFNKKPNFIIYNIDFLTFRLWQDAYAREQFFPFFFDDSLISVVKREKRIPFRELHLPLVRYFGYSDFIKSGFNAFLGTKLPTYDKLYKGYRGNEWSYNGNEFDKIDTIFYYKDLEALKLFDGYLTKCKVEGIKVILVSAPVYIKATQKIANLTGMKEMFDNIAQKHDLRILDYTSDSLCMDTAFFYNANHLNKKGAEIFSLKLANDLKRISFFDN